MNESPACDVRNGGGENVEREQENEEKFVKSGLKNTSRTFRIYYFLECVKNVRKYCKKENKLFF